MAVLKSTTYHIIQKLHTTQKKMPKILRIITSSFSFYLFRGQMEYISRHGFEIYASSGRPFDDLNKKEHQEQVKIFKIKHLVRPIRIVSDFIAIIETIRLIRKLKPDIVHTQTPKAGMVGMFAAWICNVPVRIHTVGGLRLIEEKGVFRKILDFIERATYSAATIVLPNSKSLADFIIKNKYASKEKIHVIHNGSTNGVNLESFSRTPSVMSRANKIQEELGDGFTYLFVGRIVRDKGICELIDAFTRLYGENPHIHLLLVGDFEKKLDPLPEDVYHTIQSHPAIYCAGWQDDVRPWFAAADALAFPSYREGFPNVVMQAGAMELPCVVSDINGCNEIIIEEENGLIIPSHDATALYQAMKRMMEDKALYTHCQQNARPLITSRYNQKDVWQAMLEMYNDLLPKQ